MSQPFQSPKPDWAEAPKWAKFLCMDSNFVWNWFECEPTYGGGGWGTSEGRQQRASPWIGKDSLECRP
jgi:hypothetical protein